MVDVVAKGVVDEVGDEPFDEARVASGRGRRQLRADLETAALRLRAPRKEHLLTQGGEVELFLPLKTRLPARQGEERVDQALLARFGIEELLADLAQRLGAGVGIGERHFQQGALVGERGAQLVGGVGDEPPLRLERRLEASEQAVERLTETLHLVIGALQRESPIETARRDLAGGLRHRAQRAQDSSGETPGEGDGERRHDRQRDAELDGQLIQRLLRLGLRDRACVAAWDAGTACTTVIDPAGCGTAKKSPVYLWARSR